MRHRIFIAINLPEDIKKKFLDYQRKWSELPIRWVKKENLHITLIFLGYLTNEELIDVCKITKEKAEKHQSFSLTLNKTCYGPPKKMPPRMVWIEGEKSESLTGLKNDLEKSFFDFGILRNTEKRAFSPHITLGRIRQWEWQRIEPEERLDVSEDISLSFEVQSIEVMESQLKRGGAEYVILESVSLE